jgi:hypothetical protein
MHRLFRVGFDLAQYGGDVTLLLIIPAAHLAVMWITEVAMFKQRWDLALFALLLGTASLPAFATETDLPRSWLLSPYCKGNAPVKKVFMEAKEGEFVPAEINVTKGDCVELWIRHAGGVAHSAMIEGSGLSSGGAPLFDHQGRRFGRALARANPHHPVMLEEGWFAKGEQVLLRFQALNAADHRLGCAVAESLNESGVGAQTQRMSARIFVE